jgi:hypothetical protein
MLKAYLDLSATDDPPHVTSVAGYMATTDEWDRIIPEWQALLDKWDLEEFHYKKVVRRIDPACMNDFYALLKESNVDPIGAVLFDADWEKDDWGNDATKKLPDKYQQALDHALRCIAGYCEERYPGEGIIICCDADRRARIIERAFNNLRPELPSLQSITRGNTKQDLPLQCADLSTGLLRKGWIAVDADTAARAPWSGIPSGGRGCHSVWSRKQGTLLMKMMSILGVPRTP